MEKKGGGALHLLLLFFVVTSTRATPSPTPFQTPFHFTFVGITEAGVRELGTKKLRWVYCY